ncbi:pilus assembly protein PilX [Acidovorax sp. Root275]|uniref:pilus assembly PilX family protein n=1 Tax=Acidovorax sp. Root275 TaxID=1736508 RepID=UPI00070DA885|nr:PilX N-terminal domain-containing pilus assembly protein [Acidovorax sp. Root275]KRD48459.1 pilus assembly protein PilX [Acidovorax sp. Root275]
MQSMSKKSTQYQRGISLFVVIVIVMLSALLALWGSRTSLFNEMIVGNDADYQRAFEAAQALIQDAEFDIRGERPDGTACAPNAGKPEICRVPDSVVNKVWIPTEDKEIGDILSELDSATTKCIKGICLKRTGNQDFWNDAATLTTLMADGIGARYGQFTGAEAGTKSNPILKLNQPGDDAAKGGWYWIEILPYDNNAGNTGLITNGSNSLALNLLPSVAYRITAVARGLKPSTQVVLQSTFVRQKMKN